MRIIDADGYVKRSASLDETVRSLKRFERQFFSEVR
jgi:hypothetical protein